MRRSLEDGDDAFVDTGLVQTYGQLHQTLRTNLKGRKVSGHNDRTSNGVRCDHCNELIPTFASLRESDLKRVLQLIRQGHNLMATRELVVAVDCTEEAANIWVSHRGRPMPIYPGNPCEFCGERLPTSMAKQCLACGATWHDQV